MEQKIRTGEVKVETPTVVRALVSAQAKGRLRVDEAAQQAREMIRDLTKVADALAKGELPPHVFMLGTWGHEGAKLDQILGAFLAEKEHAEVLMLLKREGAV